MKSFQMRDQVIKKTKQDQIPTDNQRFEKNLEEIFIIKKREEKKLQKEADNEDSYGSLIHNSIMSSDENSKGKDEERKGPTITKKKKGKGKIGKARVRESPNLSLLKFSLLNCTKICM